MIRKVLPLMLGILALTSSARAESFMVVEAYSGKVLIATQSTEKRPVASLTKIATGVLIVDWAEAAGVELEKTEVVVPQSAAFIPGPNPMKLSPGDSLTALDALNSALMGSDNFAAYTLANHVGHEFLRRQGKAGDPIAAFVTEMNNLAEALNMRSTKFVNPHGLDVPDKPSFSTPADMAKLSIYAMRRPAFRFVTRQEERTITVNNAAGEARAFKVENTNKLVSETVLGIKTGTTAAAGPCLAVSSERPPLIRTKPDGSKGVTPRRLIVVLLNSPDRFARAEALITKGWQTYDAWVAGGALIENRKREILDVPDPR